MDTIVDFYDTMMGVTDKIARMKQGLEMTLVQECMMNGAPVFWNDFESPSSTQLANFAKHCEGIVVRQLQDKLAVGKLKKAHVIEYGILAGKTRIASSAKGIERFAEEVKKQREEEQ